MMNRREALAAAAALLAGCGGGKQPRAAVERDASDAAPPPPPADARVVPKESPVTDEILHRPIPSTGEMIPVIGLGSWQTFDVGADEIPQVQRVMERFLALGGRVVDSSPMYGRAEEAIGAMLANLRAADASTPKPFLATKVWTDGRAAGETQMKRSLERMGTDTIDLMQIHNLRDWKAHLPTLRAWKDAGTIRYLGITHYDRGAFGEMERILEKERLDFVQLPYSVVDRTAEKRLLPAAQANGVAVLVMTPFESGDLFERVRGKALPDFAAELDCRSWAQLFLKFLVAHPAVTCPIPATGKVKHLEDNLGALRGRLPTEEERAAIVKAVS